MGVRFKGRYCFQKTNQRFLEDIFGITHIVKIGIGRTQDGIAVCIQQIFGQAGNRGVVFCCGFANAEGLMVGLWAGRSCRRSKNPGAGKNTLKGGDRAILL